jgi:perosamine synthetase
LTSTKTLNYKIGGMMIEKKLALNGGSKSIESIDVYKSMFDWPIITKEDEDAVLDVLRNRSMSGIDITKKFEKEFSDWMGSEYALAFCNGTESIRAALWACGVGAGDEVICPTITYWASCASVLTLGGAVNFADIDKDTLCIDPSDIEHRIGPKTKVIIVVHYFGYPCDMDAILKIAKKYNIKVVEDVSHAHGSLYKGKKCGTFGDISAMSLMTGKSLAIGEGGIIVTDNRKLYERCISYGHYERTGLKSNFNKIDSQITYDDLKRYAGIPLGGYKHRLNQTASAMGRVQLKYYDKRIVEIQKSLNYFWDLLKDVPGIKAHRPSGNSDSSMGGWYYPRGLYRSEELNGLSCSKFCKAVRAEGLPDVTAGANYPLHLHEMFHSADIFNMGKPTMISFGQRDVRQKKYSLPVGENIENICFGVPWFKHYKPKIIKKYADLFRKVAENADELL